jgi:hypothetical protein
MHATTLDSFYFSNFIFFILTILYLLIGDSQQATILILEVKLFYIHPILPQINCPMGMRGIRSLTTHDLSVWRMHVKKKAKSSPLIDSCYDNDVVFSLPSPSDLTYPIFAPPQKPRIALIFEQADA